jgi:hypothetical protein
MWCANVGKTGLWLGLRCAQEEGKAAVVRNRDLLQKE